ncbi:hypothetical protein [Sulfuriflexus sp.]|uniref:hypothetical protein n=1 Tax=Sulfuriflexus sp. TaxID=2015443 RepID=UPI0028CD5D20|nr:hypothetical protein [Sulfuriflexus sp.]MDT8405114.1 hypothetical protein [Sulfuriflexus sp.]
MNRIRQPDSVQDYPDTVQQLLDIDRETDDMPDVEGVHQGVILSDTWGNEWDDTGDFGEIDFRLVDDI